jgi:hypothetical protein
MKIMHSNKTSGTPPRANPTGGGCPYCYTLRELLKAMFRTKSPLATGVLSKAAAPLGQLTIKKS